MFAVPADSRAIVLPVPTKVVGGIDSLTAGTGSFNTSWPDILQTLRPSITVVNSGHGGATLAAVLIQANYDNNYGQYWIANAWAHLFGGTNDVIGGADAATTYGLYKTLGQKLRTTGYYVSASTMLPRSDAASSGAPAPGFYGVKAAFNTLLRNDWRSFAHVLVDVAADSRIGDDGDEADPVTYNYHDGTPTDLVHLNGDTPGGVPTGTGGYYIVANLIHAALPS